MVKFYELKLSVSAVRDEISLQVVLGRTVLAGKMEKRVGRSKSLFIIFVLALLQCSLVLVKSQTVDSNGVLVIPEGTQIINANAFEGRTDIQTLVLSSTVKIIDNYAFYQCAQLSNVTIASASVLTSIGNYSFAVTALENIVIPSGVVSIGDSAFYQSKLQSLTFHLGSTIQTISRNAFRETSLNNVSIPYFTEFIGDGAFSIIPSLQQIHFVEAEVGGYGEHLKVIGAGAFQGTGLTSILMPPSVKILGQSAFELCQKLTDVTFPGISMLTTLPDRAFYSSGLTSVVIPAGVTTIGVSCFASSAITSLKFAENSQLTTIGEQAFTGTSIGSVTFPNTVTTLGFQAFKNCKSLSSITWNSGSQLNVIGESAFMDDIILTSVAFPVSVKTIKKNAFNHCTSLSSAIFICHSTTSIESGAFSFTALSSLNIGPTDTCEENCFGAGIVNKGENCSPTMAPTTASPSTAFPTFHPPTYVPSMKATLFPTATNGGLNSGKPTGAGSAGTAIAVTFSLLGAFGGLYYFFIVVPAKNKSVMEAAMAANTDTETAASPDVEVAKPAPKKAGMIQNPMIQ